MSTTETMIPCRDERCRLTMLHGEHPINAKVVYFFGEAITACDCLDHYIVDALRTYEVRVMAQIVEAIRDSYGTCCPRRLQRHIATLAAEGKIGIINVGRGSIIRGYTRIDSPLLRDPWGVAEQIYDAVGYEA